MNTYLIIGCCSIAIGCGSLKANGRKRNWIACLNLALGLLLILLGIFTDH